MSDNILLQEWLARYNSQPPEIRKELDKLANDMGKAQLISIKRSYKSPETGDIFVFQPKEHIYFYGIVLNAHVSYMSFKDLYVVALFKIKSDTIQMRDFAVDYDKLFIPPLRVDRYYWNTGLFYKVGRLECEEFMPTPSYGFYDSDCEHPFSDEYGNILDERPEYLSIGVATSIGVGYKINKELIIDNTLI